MKVCLSLITRAALCASFLVAHMTAASAVQLVTEQEAGYPDDPYGTTRGSPTAGPEVEVVSPSVAGLIKSPFNLKVRFRAHGGAEVDRDSVAITYRKVPAIDVTQRIAPFIRANGIDMQDAELPPGKHSFRIDIKDTRGRWAAPFFFNIGVAK